MKNKALFDKHKREIISKKKKQLNKIFNLSALAFDFIEISFTKSDFKKYNNKDNNQANLFVQKFTKARNINLKSTNYIYYFTISTPTNYSLSKFMDQINKVREADKSSIHISKINKTNLLENHKYLYVGSLNGTKFETRLKQHLGYGSMLTYSLKLLYLLKQLDNTNYKFRMYYYQLEADKFYIRTIEDIYKKMLTPWMGKEE